LHELSDVQRRDPLDMPGGYILNKMGRADKDFINRVAGRAEEVLDLTDFFLTAGLKSDAISILKEFYLDVDKKEPAPMAYYYYGILNKDEKVLAQGMAMSPDYVFPNSLNGAAVLKEAIAREPKDWKARLYLGNFLFEHSQKDSAVALWKEALAINGSYSVLHRDLGLVAWKSDKNYWNAATHYEKALQCNPNDITLYRDLATIYIENTQQYQRAKDLLEEQVINKKNTRADLVSLLTRVYNLTGEYDKSIALLAANSYVNWEGRGSLYAYYTDAHMGKGQQLYKKGKYKDAYKEFETSINYPMTLGPGLTTDPVSAPSHYWMGMALEKMGRKDDAMREWKLASEQTDKGSDENKKYAMEAKDKITASR